MFRCSILKRFTPFVIASVLISGQAAAGQGVLDRLKRAAEEAAKKAEDARKAADAKQAAEEAARREKEKTTPAVPGGGNPNANSPNAATPAQPGGRGGSAGPSSVPASSAKVEELSLASGQKLNFVVGPKGGHAAAVVLRGSRTVVVHDGVDGPRFDAIIGESEGLVFSPDGSRLAYLGRQGTDYVFMADGKELLRVPAAAHPRIDPHNSPSIQFTDNSRHVYFQLYTEAPGGSTGNGAHRLFVDGVPGPESFSPVTPVFAAGGDHHTYLVESRQKRGTYGLVVDGKPTPIAGEDPQMTADGLHVFTKRVVPGGAVEVLLDGKPIMKAQAPRIYTTPVGSGFMTIVSQGPRGSGIEFLTMGTQRIAGTDCPSNSGYSNIAFSPDAKHWAAACQASPSSHWIVADGKKGQEYQGLLPVGFDAAGRFVYGANMRNQTFLVVGDQESEAYGPMLTAINDAFLADYKPPVGFNPVPPPAVIAGNHIAFTAQAGGTMRTVVVDGKSLQRDGAGAVTFSADGSHFAFTFGRQPRTVNVDGKDLPGSAMLFQQAAVNRRNRPRVEFTLSPDGRHVAYFETQPNNSTALHLDGKLAVVFPGANPENLTFTPDSRHLFWLANSSSGQTVYLDGRPAARFDFNQLMQLAPGTWEMGADGTLTVVAQSGDAIKRFRITPGSDTGLDTIGK